MQNGIIAAIVLVPMLLSAAEADVTAADAFKQLTSLVGEWQGRFPDGRAHAVSYRLTAGGTVLVETWTLAPNRESMTLYSISGSDLLATHYCPQGNQPRLRLARGGRSDRLRFQFMDGGNLDVPGKSHQHAFWVRFDGPNSYTRSETYVPNGSTPAEVSATREEPAITYTRSKAEP